jgi:hypothetical protein
MVLNDCLNPLPCPEEKKVATEDGTWCGIKNESWIEKQKSGNSNKSPSESEGLGNPFDSWYWVWIALR